MSEALLIGHNSEKNVVSWGPFSSSLYRPVKIHVLSRIAAIFDPLDYLCPVIIKAKIFMQQLWEKNMSWDDPLPTSLRNEWAKIVYDLQNLSTIQIPRYVNTERDGTEEYQLICFMMLQEKPLQQLFTSE